MLGADGSSSAGASPRSSRRAPRSSRASPIATASIVEAAEADILVGADGIHSAVRAHFYPDEGPPKWQGILMWRGVTVGKPYFSGASMVQAGHHTQKFVCYPISRAHAERGEALINWICDLYRPARGAAARGLEQAGQARGLPAALQGLGLRLAERAGGDPQRPHHPGIPDGRPRSAAALEPWPHHAAGRCGASDVPDRLQRRLAGDHRRRGADPGAVDRRRSRSSLAALRAAPPAADGAHRREQPAQGHRRDARPRRGARAAGLHAIWKACCRPPSWSASSATTRSWRRRTARRCSSWRQGRQ